MSKTASPNQDQNSESVTKYSSVVTIVVALIGLFGTVVASVISSSSFFKQYAISLTPTPVQELPLNATELGDELDSLQGEILLIQQQLDSISENYTEAAIAAELVKLNKSIDGLSNRIEIVEQAVLDSPEKALSITLLRKDMETLQEKYEANTEMVRDEINRVSGLNQSLIILMMTSMVGLVSLAAANLFQIRRKGQEKLDESVNNKDNNDS